MSDIQIRLTGGIGNQLFQWAYGRYLSDSGHDVTYDTSFYDMDFTTVRNTQRKFQLPELITEQVNINKNKQSRKVVSDQHVYEKRQFKDSIKYRLEGWWQSEKYFKDSESTIRQAIKPYDDQSYSEYGFTDSCSMHIRRTDYVTKYSKGYPVLTPQYYRRALNIMQPRGNIYVFSDDIKWCEENIVNDQCVYVTEGSDIDQLKIMSLCNNNIGANSSYSWWASWLNKHTDKKIVMPDKISLNTSYKDFYTNSMIQLPID